MTLLSDIQAAATQDGGNIASLLRRCQILARRLKSEQFAHWVESELGGYKAIEGLPDYRILPNLQMQGDFQYGRLRQRLAIPIELVPESVRPELRQEYMLEPIATYGTLVEADKRIFRLHWDNSILAQSASQIAAPWICTSAWKLIPKTAVIALLDAVKTRIVQMTLDLEALNPAAGDTSADDSRLPADVVERIVSVNIFGAVDNLAVEARNFTQQHGRNNSDSRNYTLEMTLRNLSQIQEKLPVHTEIVVAVQLLFTSNESRVLWEKYLFLASIMAEHLVVYGSSLGPALRSAGVRIGIG